MGTFQRDSVIYIPTGCCPTVLEEIPDPERQRGRRQNNILSLKLGKLLSMNIDSSGNTMLHVASKAGHKDIIYLLLQHGSDPTVK